MQNQFLEFDRCSERDGTRSERHAFAGSRRPKSSRGLEHICINTSEMRVERRFYGVADLYIYRTTIFT